MIMIILSIVLGFLGLFCGISALVYGIHVAVVFQRFNDGIKDWAGKLDDATNAAINRAARNILRELDERISAEKEIVKPINIDENGED